MAIPLDVTMRRGRRAIFEWLTDGARKIPMPEGWIIDKVEHYEASGLVEIHCTTPAFEKMTYTITMTLISKAVRSPPS